MQRNPASAIVGEMTTSYLPEVWQGISDWERRAKET
jgi:hypothetical protein